MANRKGTARSQSRVAKIDRDDIIPGLAERMRITRIGSKATQQEAAKMIHVSDSAYKNYEVGLRNPPISILREFSQVFSADFMWLVYGRDDPTMPKRAELFGSVIETVFAEVERRGLKDVDALMKRVCLYSFKSCHETNARPENVVRSAFDLALAGDG